jgi:3-oxoacyl-(acyl-carrier-protein) synthase
MSRLSAVISGVGIVSAAGADKASTLDSFRRGVRNYSTKQPFETTVCAPTFQVRAALPELPGRMNASRTLRLAMRAVNEAMGEAAFARFEEGTRVGVCLGTTVGCQLNNVSFYAAYRRGESPGLDPVYNFLSTNLAKSVAELVGARGPRMTVVNACSSGTDAIGVAAGWIEAGLCDVAIAGGADEMYIVPLSGFWSLGVMSAEPCAPFDRDRAGLNLGEGAGVLILESEEHARKRGAKAEFEVAGFGAACDAHHLTAPHPEGRGLEAAVRAALGRSNVDAADVAFINAHGTATQDNDRAEGKVIARLFGTNTPFLSTKGFTGHTLGAAGGLEAAFALMGLREGWIPGSAGFSNPSEDVAVMPVRRVTEISGRYAVSTSLAFGGNNAAVLIGRRS